MLPQAYASARVTAGILISAFWAEVTARVHAWSGPLDGVQLLIKLTVSFLQKVVDFYIETDHLVQSYADSNGYRAVYWMIKILTYVYFVYIFLSIPYVSRFCKSFLPDREATTVHREIVNGAIVTTTSRNGRIIETVTDKSKDVSKLIPEKEAAMDRSAIVSTEPVDYLVSFFTEGRELVANGFRVGDYVYTAKHAVQEAGLHYWACSKDYAGYSLTTFLGSKLILVDQNAIEFPFSDEHDIARFLVAKDHCSKTGLAKAKLKKKPVPNQFIQVTSYTEPGFRRSTGRVVDLIPHSREFTHSASTEVKMSGSPVLCGSSLVGMHLGYDAKTKKNRFLSFAHVEEMFGSVPTLQVEERDDTTEARTAAGYEGDDDYEAREIRKDFLKFQESPDWEDAMDDFNNAPQNERHDFVTEGDDTRMPISFKKKFGAFRVQLRHDRTGGRESFVKTVVVPENRSGPVSNDSKNSQSIGTKETQTVLGKPSTTSSEGSSPQGTSGVVAKPPIPSRESVRPAPQVEDIRSKPPSPSPTELLALELSSLSTMLKEYCRTATHRQDMLEQYLTRSLSMSGDQGKQPSPQTSSPKPLNESQANSQMSKSARRRAQSRAKQGGESTSAQVAI